MDWKRKNKEDAEKALQEFANVVNNLNFDKEAFINAFRKEHRTTQQSMTRAMFAIIESVASDSYRFDDRNEGAHNIAKKLLKGFKIVLSEEDQAKGYSKEQTEKYLNDGNCVPSAYLGCI